MKKSEFGYVTYYLRSSVLGGQVIAELDGSGNWSRGYVYAGNSLMAVQQGGVFWTYEDAVTKSKRVCDVNGNIVSAIELDPWGADTNRSGGGAFQPHKYTSYERDGNGSDEAMFRRYNRQHSRFDQPDPSVGNYDFSDPQSLNRYAYTQNDPVNFRDLIQGGIVVGPATLLPDPNNASSIGITEAARARDVGSVGSTAIQAITIRDHPGYKPDTTDGRARIFLNSSAFGGGALSLREVLVHELIHVAGVDAKPPGFFGSLLGRDDLSYYKYYDSILKACK